MDRPLSRWYWEEVSNSSWKGGLLNDQTGQYELEVRMAVSRNWGENSVSLGVLIYANWVNSAESKRFNLRTTPATFFRDVENTITEGMFTPMDYLTKDLKG